MLPVMDGTRARGAGGGCAGGSTVVQGAGPQPPAGPRPSARLSSGQRVPQHRGDVDRGSPFLQGGHPRYGQVRENPVPRVTGVGAPHPHGNHLGVTRVGGTPFPPGDRNGAHPTPGGHRDSDIPSPRGEGACGDAAGRAAGGGTRPVGPGAGPRPPLPRPGRSRSRPPSARGCGGPRCPAPRSSPRVPGPGAVSRLHPRSPAAR